jgi:hypothetical protein
MHAGLYQQMEYLKAQVAQQSDAGALSRLRPRLRLSPPHHSILNFAQRARRSIRSTDRYVIEFTDVVRKRCAGRPTASSTEWRAGTVTRISGAGATDPDRVVYRLLRRPEPPG